LGSARIAPGGSTRPALASGGERSSGCMPKASEPTSLQTGRETERLLVIAEGDHRKESFEEACNAAVVYMRDAAERRRCKPPADGDRGGGVW
jgi:hypothetical protein